MNPKLKTFLQKCLELPWFISRAGSTVFFQNNDNMQCMTAIIDAVKKSIRKQLLYKYEIMIYITIEI